MSHQSDAQETFRQFQSPPKLREQDKNAIKTSHYTWYNFFFLNIFEQFHRLANIFFLCCATLQAIPVISPLNPVMGFLSLGGMLLISMIKAGLEDYKRHVQDDIQNSKQATIFSQNETFQVKWAEINPGDILKISTDEEFPADCVILESYSNDNKCKIETAALDGETNLKFRTGISDDQTFKLNKFTIETSNPEPQMNQFVGKLFVSQSWQEPIPKPPEEVSVSSEVVPAEVENELEILSDDDNFIPLTLSSFVPRGCFLRKTPYVYALAVYTGEETKVIQNAIKPRFKYTEIDRFMAHCVIVLIFVLLVLAVIFDLCAFHWAKTHNEDQYLQLEEQSKIYYFYNVFSWLLIINMLIPLCCYSSLDLVRFFLGINITKNGDMNENGSYVKCQNSDLVSTIGRITYMFSDKTGTLTKNKMTLKALLVDAFIAGNETIAAPNSSTDLEKMITLSTEDINSIKTQLQSDFKMQLFLYTLCLCNSAETVINSTYYPIKTIQDKFPNYEYTYDIPPIDVVKQFPYTISYQTTSPDEVALLHLARECGYILYNVSGTMATLIVNGEVIEVERPIVFQFSSQRKRASCLVLLDKTYYLLTKGADSAIFPRSTQLAEKARNGVDSFSSQGLRTLVYGYKIVKDPFPLLDEYNKVLGMLSGGEEALASLTEREEQEFTCFALTGVEDELQDDVQQTLFRLRQAGINIWMLTGDKLDTALNIAASSGLKARHFQSYILTSLDDVDGMASIDLENTILAIEGSIMSQLFKNQAFFEYAKKAGAVVFARCEPSQKGECVRTFKELDKKAIVLAIGDGANDVDMIRSADVGVGVEGKEGSEAVLSSDFSIPSFHFIAPLLIVHGHWCVNRTTLLILMTFYKNTMICLMQILFGIFNGFSATSAYDSGFLSIYNLLLTVPQLFFLCVFEEDVDAKYVLAIPQTYREYAANGTIGFRPMFWMYIHALIHSSVIFFFSFFESNTVLLDITGKTFDLPIFSQITAWAVLIVFTCELLMKFKVMTLIHIGLYICCILVYVVCSFFYSYTDKMFYNILGIAFTVPRIWIMIPFAAGCCIIVDMIGIYLSPMFYPSVAESVAELEFAADRGSQI